MRPSSDSIGAIEGKMKHFETEVMKYHGGTAIDPDDWTGIQDCYFLGCALIDRCLAVCGIWIEYDWQRCDTLASLSRLNRSIEILYTRFMNLLFGYQWRLHGYLAVGPAGETLAEVLGQLREAADDFYPRR